ncbi:hypothetical protein COO60DRAFT_1634287 [Scenedesmus sp. NREL 46B-D3]|nr:hypothetical protein COO60DRAFT_1634287 [Scenedesmus sp. NREL 46B-D3]
MHGRNELRGYGFCHIPTAPGDFEIDCPTWLPEGSVGERIAAYFVGGAPRLRVEEVVFSPGDRFRLQTVAGGIVHLHLGIIMKDFEKNNVHCASGKDEKQPDPAALLQQALQYRDKLGATAREQKLAFGLLKDAAGLSSAKQHAGKEPAAVPVPGVPELVFVPGGNAAALRELAKCYQRGKGVDVNHKLSLELFRRAAELGDAEAQGVMAMRMAFGLHHSNSFEGSSIRHFGRPDEASALLHYYFGAADGDAFSRAALGYRHTFGLGVPKSCWTAVSYYQPVAEAVVQEAVDAAKARGPLGSSSGHGLPQIERIRLNVHANQGIKPDRQREVLQYYQYSADRGNIDAQTAVGTLLNLGTHGVSRDHSAAAHYLARAAAAGNDEAMAHLGHMHGAGMGMPQDFAKAHQYFSQSAARQNPLGLYGLGYLYLSGSGGLGMRRRSLSKAFLHYFQAAQAGHVQAMYNTAVMHMAGKGTPKACKPALSNLKALVEKGPLAAALQAGHEAFFRASTARWALLLYLQASELGMEIGQSNAAWMLDRGFAHAGHQAASVATALFKRSAEQGNVMSLLQLGDCYYYGNGVEQDWVRASAIYYEAYKERSAEAMFNLGYMHEYGAGVPKDLDLARRFYGMAKHANADAALPVYLANAWLRLHEGWEWLRGRLPSGLGALVLPVNWMFELRPVPGSPAARSFAAVAAGSGVALGSEVIAGKAGQPVLPDGSIAVAGSAGSGGSAAPALPPAAAGAGSSAAKPPGGTAGGGYGGAADEEEAEQRQSRGWLWWLSPQLLVWQWDGLVWRLAEATGLGGLSIGALIEEYQDAGETLLLLVLMAVLLLVLRIRRQRQQALEQQVRAALAQGAPPEEQQLAAAIAAQMGLQIPRAPTAVTAAPVTAAGAGAAAAARSSEAAATAGAPGAGAGSSGSGSGSVARPSSAAAHTASPVSGVQRAPQQNGFAAEEQKQQVEAVPAASSSVSSSLEASSSSGAAGASTATSSQQEAEPANGQHGSHADS